MAEKLLAFGNRLCGSEEELLVSFHHFAIYLVLVLGKELEELVSQLVQPQVVVVQFKVLSLRLLLFVQSASQLQDDFVILDGRLREDALVADVQLHRV